MNARKKIIGIELVSLLLLSAMLLGIIQASNPDIQEDLVKNASLNPENCVWATLVRQYKASSKTSILGALFGKMEFIKLIGNDHSHATISRPDLLTVGSDSKLLTVGSDPKLLAMHQGSCPRLDKYQKYWKKAILEMNKDEFIDFYLKQNYNPTVEELVSIMDMLTQVDIDNLILTCKAARKLIDKLISKYANMEGIDQSSYEIYQAILLKVESVYVSETKRENDELVTIWIEAIDAVINLCGKILAYRDEYKKVVNVPKYIDRIDTISIKTTVANNNSQVPRIYLFISKMAELSSLALDGDSADILHTPHLLPEDLAELEVRDFNSTITISNELCQRLTNLEIIEIRVVNEVKIERDFIKLSNLQKISIFKSRIYEGFEYIDSLPSLIFLDLWHCDFKRFAPKNLPGLEMIWFGECPELEYLNLDAGDSENMRSLKILYMSDCHGMRMIPSEIKRFSQLEIVYLTSFNLDVNKFSICNEETNSCVELEDRSGLVFSETLNELTISIDPLKHFNIPWIENCPALWREDGRVYVVKYSDLTSYKAYYVCRDESGEFTLFDLESEESTNK